MTPTGPTGEQFTISSGATSATVVEVGGGLRSVAIAGHVVLDGYDADAMADSGRGQVLIPWPNRLDHGRYEWGGQTLQVPINEIVQRAGDLVADLIRADGYEPVRVGGLDQAIRIEMYGDLHEYGALGRAVTKSEALAAV